MVVKFGDVVMVMDVPVVVTLPVMTGASQSRAGGRRRRGRTREGEVRRGGVEGDGRGVDGVGLGEAFDVSVEDGGDLGGRRQVRDLMRDRGRSKTSA